jgi:hypothetical protein
MRKDVSQFEIHRTGKRLRKKTSDFEQSKICI